TGSSPLTMLGSSYVSSIQLSSKRVYRFRVEATLRFKNVTCELLTSFHRIG
ncbi:MAG: hypothetical protein ACI9TI_001660, partial [Natronomonas sp.]